MEAANWHIFQVLTKRSSRMRSYVNARFSDRPAPPHLWLGVSVEDGSKLSRVRHLQETRARVRFLSVEPLIGPVGRIDLDGIHWVIAGGESGPKARPMQIAWARDIRDRCIRAGVPFFFKQWGGPRPKSGGRLLDEQEWNEFPEIAGDPEIAAKHKCRSGLNCVATRSTAGNVIGALAASPTPNFFADVKPRAGRTRHSNTA